MKKIPSLFKRDYEGTHLVYDEVVEGCEWVLNGEGVATQKYDGTACMIKGGVLFKRYDVKAGRTPPSGAIPCEEQPTGHNKHWPHWVPASKDDPADRWFFEVDTWDLPDGTYELIGEKVNGNNERITGHRLIRHGEERFYFAPRTFNELKTWLESRDIEGIVWHHPDGRMAKIKKKDFGLPRKPQNNG